MGFNSGLKGLNRDCEGKRLLGRSKRRMMDKIKLILK
jgi:hypothetical protein